MPDEDRPIEAIRKEIDTVDDELIRLLNRRTELAQEVGRVKGKDQKAYFTPERERQVFEALAEKNKGPLQQRQIQSIFREIVSAARAAEKQLSCAYWGPPGTFTHMAAQRTFGASSDLVPLESIEDVFFAVEHHECDYGVAPIENSMAGIVPETLDMFPTTNVRICAEAYLPVHHHLVSLAGSLGEVKCVYAGPQPAQQCRKWLKSNLPGVPVLEVTPTSRAAEKALDDRTTAAIASETGAQVVGIPVLHAHIEDHSQNRTRFVVLGFNEPTPTGRDKTSLMFNVRNQPGALYRALGALQSHGVNLSLIASRPAQREAFEYYFYLDAVGHREDEPMKAALATLKASILEMTVLGSYPLASL